MYTLVIVICNRIVYPAPIKRDRRYYNWNNNKRYAIVRIRELFVPRGKGKGKNFARILANWNSSSVPNDGKS